MSHLANLRTLLDLPALRHHLGPYGDWLDDGALETLLERTFLRDLRVLPSPGGDAQSWRCTVVLPQSLSFPLPLQGLVLTVNPAAVPGAPAELRATADFHLPVLRYLAEFDPAVLGGSARGGFEFLLAIAKPSAAELVAAAIGTLIDGEDPTRALLDDYAARHGALNVPLGADGAADAAAIATAMQAAGVDPADYLFAHYVDAPQRTDAHARLSLLFNAWYDFSPADLERLTTPVFAAALHDLEIALTLPRWLLLPIKTVSQEAAGIAPGTAVGEPLPEPLQAGLRAQVATLGFSTELGFRTGSGVTFSLDEAEIGATGLRLAVAGLSFDLSRRETPRALRQAGFSPAFVGLHAAAAKLVWLPALRRLAGDLPGIELALRDLAIGSEGLLAVAEQRWGIDAADPLGGGSGQVVRIGGGWRAALAEADGSLVYRRLAAGGTIQEDWRATLAVAGLLELPFRDVLLGVRFALELEGGLARTRMEVMLASAPLVVALGAEAGLTFDALEASGILATDGSFALAGSARGLLDIGAGGLRILQGGFDAPGLSLAYAGQAQLRLDGVFNAVLFSGTPFSTAIENLHGRLLVQAADGGIEQFSLELSGFTAELQLTDAIAVRIEDCVLDLNTAASSPALLELGFDAGFIGLLAQQGTLRWALPGAATALQVPLGLVAVGSGGAAFRQNQAAPLLSLQLFDELTLALTGVDGLLLLDGRPGSRLEISGSLQVPALAVGFEGRLYLQQGPGADQVRLNLKGSGLVIALGDAGTLSVDALEIEGVLAATGFALFGQATGATLTLEGFDQPVSLGGALLRLERAGTDTRLLVALNGAQIGLAAAAGLSFGSQLTVTLRAGAVTGVLLSGEASWEDLGSFELPALFPQPPADAELRGELRWEAGAWQLSFRAALDDPGPLLAVLPAPLRPDLRNLEFVLDAAYQSSDGSFSGTAAVALELRLRALSGFPGTELVKLRSGDPNGWIRARIHAGAGSGAAGTASRFSLDLSDLLTVDVDLPGLPQAEPVVHSVLDQARLEFHDGVDAGGLLELAGTFSLRPLMPAAPGLPVPQPIRDKLAALLGGPRISALSGSATHSLRFSGDQVQVDLVCVFAEAGLEVNLFDLLAGAAGGAGAGMGEETSAIELDIGFRLERIAVSLGSLDPAQSGRFSFALNLGLEIAGLYSSLSLELSDQRLAFGIDELAIPVALPELPIARAHLDALRAADGRWDADIWSAVASEIEAELSQAASALAHARGALEQLQAAAAEGGAEHARQVFELRYRVVPELQKRVFHHTGNKFLTGAIMAVHEHLGRLSGSASQATYQSLVELYQDAVDATVGSLHFDTRLQFVIADAKFVLPFDDPANVRVEGGASLQGFAPDDPLAPMESLLFKLGLSADAIFFAVEGGAEPLPLPDFGRYPGNGIVFDRLIIGYGYSKNSLLVDFAGELRLSPALIEDLDTSSRSGAGLRLPGNGRLKFKIDLIPIVLGEVDFLLPLLAFDIDLRSANPPLAGPPDGCAPAWDGLQFNAPGVLRADFKRAKVAPFFGPLPAPNYLYAFDLDVGNDALGFTQICDDYQAILGLLTIPFLTDGTPFFERYCTNLRLAGFGINFDLRRPFPHPSPLMIFELLGFLSDPSLPVDPAGHLAEIMWAELRNARITLPPAVLGMFPEQGRVISRTIDARINVGTVIALAQQLARVVDDLRARVAQTGVELGDLVNAITLNPPPVPIAELLDVLPRALRRVELQGSFVGFDASAVFLLVSPDTLARALAPAAPSPGASGGGWRNVVEDDFAGASLQGWRAVNHGLKRGQAGDWSIREGALVQRNNVGDNSAGRYGAALIRETEPLADLRVTLVLQSTDDDGIGVLFHVQGDTTYYRFRMTSAQKSWQLMRLKGGVTRVLHQSASAFVPNQRYPVRIEARTVQQDSSALPGRLADRSAAGPLRDRPPRAAGRLRYTTRIRIWVGDALWCDVVDDDLPLTGGQVGLDSWWNDGARYTGFRIDRADRRVSDALHPDTRALAGDLVPLTDGRGSSPPETPATAAWMADDLAGFSEQDLRLALPDTATPAVVVAARVKLLANQVYRFVGSMQTDGHFHLATSAQVEPLHLEVAGVEVPSPLQVHGHIALDGRSAGADSWARFTARLQGEWTLLPGDAGPLARLVIGREAQPADIVADSRGQFRLRGAGALWLFAGQVRIDGSVDVSDRHVFVAGALHFSPALQVDPHTPVLDLELVAAGRVGPGRFFSLAGAGALSLLGRPFSEVAGELSADGLRLEARLAAGAGTWNLAGFPLTGVEMALQGRVGFGGPVPSLSFEGAARVQIADARVAGRCRISAGADGWCLAASGALQWQGQNWLQGTAELCNDRLTVQGQTRFALNLTQSTLPGNIQIAGLYLSATVGGSFTLRASGGLEACGFDLDWTLAIRLPGSRADQSLPIVAQRLHVSRSNLAAGDSDVLLANLVDIDGITLFPLDGILLPLPRVSATETTDFYLHTGAPVNPPALTLPISILTTDPGPPAAPNAPGPLPGTFWQSPLIDIPEFQVPIPFLSDAPPASDPNQDPVISLPRISIEEVPLEGGLRLPDLVLGLQLRWKDGKLGIRVVQTQQFIAFDSLPQLLLVTGISAIAGGGAA